MNLYINRKRKNENDAKNSPLNDRVSLSPFQEYMYTKNSWKDTMSVIFGAHLSMRNIMNVVEIYLKRE